MKATFDFIPVYCPNCGCRLGLTGCNLEDYQSGETFTCECGLRFKKEKPILIDLCYEDGCTETAIPGSLYCAKHQAVPVTGEKCAYCNEPAVSDGLCREHLERHYQNWVPVLGRDRW